MTTAREADFIPGDLAVYATLDAEVKLAVGRIQALNVPGSLNPDTLVTKVHVLWTAKRTVINIGRTVELDSEFNNFITDEDERLQRELADLNPPLPRITGADGETRVNLGTLKQQALQCAWSDKQVPEEVIKRFLMEGGAIERLVASGRVPLFQDFETGDILPDPPYIGLPEKMIFCMVPPHGTRFGDELRRYEGGIYEVTSPLGEVRGTMQYVTLTVLEGTEMQSRVDRAVRKIQSA